VYVGDLCIPQDICDDMQRFILSCLKENMFRPFYASLERFCAKEVPQKGYLE